MSESRKIIVILGPTASGKSNVAIKLAKKFNSEVISADSRQIFKHMNIGSGKIPRDPFPKVQPSEIRRLNLRRHYSGGIPHHMIDIVSPKTDYNVAKFKKAVDKIIPDILKRGKVPIICGGTGFWIRAIVDNMKFPAVKPDWKLRKKLDKYANAKLIEILRNLDPERAENIDKNNKVRLIRAIEIARVLGKVPHIDNLKRLGLSQPQRPKEAEPLEFLQIGLKVPRQKLYQNIKKRLDARFKQGMVKEVRDLHFKYGVSWKRLEYFGLEYKWIALFLQNKIDKEKMEEKLLQEIKNYSKRQMTWFKKDKRIKWMNSYNIMEMAVIKFLKK
jgi:tRNA dimethylallyltransferase